MFLHFFEHNEETLNKWAHLAATRRITGIAGTDAHRNHFSMKMRDSERMDSYRRVMRWFSNMVYLPGDKNRETIMDALRAGRTAVAFEALGTPHDFKMTVETSSEIYTMGHEIPITDGPVLRVQAPDFKPDFKHLLEQKLDHEQKHLAKAPKTKIAVLRSTGSEWKEVYSTRDRYLELPIEEPGVYRVEISIRPTHLSPFLGVIQQLRILSWYPWVMTNPIYVLEQ